MGSTSIGRLSRTATTNLGGTESPHQNRAVEDAAGVPRRCVPGALAVVLAAAILCGAAGPIEAATLRGQVVSSDDGAPLALANVSIIGTTHGTVTDDDGRFELDLPAARYQVQVSYVGYRTTTTTATVGNTGAQLWFRLEPEAEVMDEIETIGNRELVDVKQTSTRRRVDRQEILSMPVDEVQAVVGRQVGVSLYENEVHIRGGRHNEAVFVVDGVVVKDYISGQSRAGDLSSRSVAEIDVLTGGYSAEYGQALSGVINVKTREGGDRHHGYIGWVTDHPVSGWDGFRSDNVSFQVDGPLFKEESPELIGGITLPGRISYLFEMEGRLSDTYLPGFTASGPARVSSYQDKFLGRLFSYGTNLSTRAENNWQMLGKLTWRMSQNDKLTLSLNKSLNINSGFFHRPIIRRDPTLSTTYPYAYSRRLNHYLTFTEDKAVMAGVWTHHFDKNTFQDLRVSRFFTNDHQSVNGKAWFDYVEPNDDQLPDGDPHSFFIDSGDFPIWHDHSIEEFTVDWDLTAQRDNYTLKTGLEHSAQIVQFIDIQEPWREDPDGLGGQHDLYTVHPQVGAGYLQSKFEYEGLVANLGLRLDYWYPGPEVEAAVSDTSRAGTTLGMQQSFEDDTISFFGRSAKYRLSPRVSVSHPITDRDHFFFNYGRFMQWPTYFYVYSKIGSVSSEEFPLIGNLNLNPEVSSQFEFGGAHEFSDDLAMNLTLFFKDQYDYPVATRFSKLGQGDFFIYRNSDYARSRGIELEVKRRPTPHFGYNLGYTFSIATGRSSDPNEFQELQEIVGAAGQIGLEEGFMWWNRPHKLTASFEYNIRRGDHSVELPYLGWRVPHDLSTHLFYQVQSGRAYTPENENGARIGKRYSKNASPEHRVDVKVRKGWKRWGYRLTGTFEVRNLFNTRTARRIDPSTGDAPVDGIGQYENPPTDDGARQVRDAILNNPSNYSQPRQARVGLGLSW